MSQDELGLSSNGDANVDLVWNLDAFKQRQVAEEFVLRFENKLCVYSSSVGQLYTNYSIFMPVNESSRLVILPNPHAHYDVFNNIPESAVRATGLNIVPNNTGQLMMRVPVRNSESTHRLLPLQAGFRLINARRPARLPLLPVLIKGDLRELNAHTPCLHLHAMALKNLSQLSSLEVRDIRDTILERLSLLD